MSPKMRAVPRIDPSSRRVGFATDGGPTSATGSPNRVTSTGLPVFRTRSSTARQVALNFEMAICSIAPSILWSQTMVKHIGKDGDVGRPVSLQLRVLRLGFFQDGDVWVCVFPEAQKILIGSAGFGGVAGEGIRAGQA